MEMEPIKGLVCVAAAMFGGGGRMGFYVWIFNVGSSQESAK